MFGGFGLPDMGDMIKQVNDFKALFDRYVKATEENNARLARIEKALNIQPVDGEVTDAEFTEAN